MYGLMITSSQLKLFSTRTFLRATRVEKRGRKSSSHELTLPKHFVKRELNTSKHTVLDRGYPENFIQEALSEVHFEDRKLALQSINQSIDRSIDRSINQKLYLTSNLLIAKLPISPKKINL